LGESLKIFLLQNYPPIPQEDTKTVATERLHVRRGVWRTLFATSALLFCAAASALAAAQSMDGRPETATAPGAEGRTRASPNGGLYLELQLAQRLKVSKLKTGDVLEGKLSRDVYRSDREVFPAGSTVRLSVAKLERRKRQSRDHWRG